MHTYFIQVSRKNKKQTNKKEHALATRAEDFQPKVTLCQSSKKRSESYQRVWN